MVTPPAVPPTPITSIWSAGLLRVPYIGPSLPIAETTTTLLADGGGGTAQGNIRQRHGGCKTTATDDQTDELTRPYAAPDASHTFSTKGRSKKSGPPIERLRMLIFE